jgi:Flp pilus assembly protein TadG
VRFPLPRHGMAILRRHANEGVVAIEFALFALLFLIILAGTVDVGLLMYTASQLDAAVSAGAEYAENNAPLVSSNPSTLCSDISTFVDSVNGTGWATSTVDVNDNCSNNAADLALCYCPTGTPSNNWSWGGTETCGSTCAGGGVAGQFVTIIANRSVSPIFPTFGFVKNGMLSRSAVVETQ